MKTLCSYISKYMGVIVLVVALFAYFFPDIFRVMSPSLINYLLGVVMFGMGMMLRLDDFKILFKRPKEIAIGLSAQFLIMPLLAWLLTKFFGLDNALAIGVILVGCCPGGTASNVITFLSKGDLALSVGMTGVSTLVSPLLTPFLTWLLAGEHIDVDMVNMFQSILWVIILPIILGIVVKRLWGNLSDKATAYLPAFSSIVIATIVAIVISVNADELAKGNLIIILVVILHNLCGLGLGLLVAWLFRLPMSKRKAISIEVGMQNSGLASSLAHTHFAAYPLSTVPGAIFSVWHNISGAILSRIYARFYKDKSS